MNVPTFNAAQSHFYAQHNRDDAQPDEADILAFDWAQMSPYERDAERSEGSGSKYYPLMEVGECFTCGGESCILDDVGFCSWCGALPAHRWAS